MRTAPAKLPGLLVVLWLVSACSILPKPAPDTIDQYVLEYSAGTQHDAGHDGAAPVVIVTTPRAHGGYDTQRIAYMQKAYGLRYYTRSRWADTPARMLAPLIADAMQATGRFEAFHMTPGSITADIRLDTELVRLHQDFTRQPGEMRITLRVQLVDLRAGRVIATQQFDVVEVSASEDAYGGVVAANQAVNRLLGELTQFCLANQPR